MIATTIEQSKHLLELGLDPKTADCGYFRVGGGDEWFPFIIYYKDKEIENKVDLFGEENVVVAWSLSALLEVMPKELLPELEWREGEEEWEVNIWINHHIHSVSHYDKECAAYAMVCWLLENNLIKKGGQDE